MAGRGLAPKPADQRARTNADPIPTVALDLPTGAPQPKLGPPPAWLEDGWPSQTKVWWRHWGESAQAELFTASDWDVLLETAAIHARFWLKGETSVAAELRLRAAKFGATVEDRARLRMVATTKSDETASEAPVAARERYGKLRMLPGASNALAGS